MSLSPIPGPIKRAQRMYYKVTTLPFRDGRVETAAMPEAEIGAKAGSWSTATTDSTYILRAAPSLYDSDQHGRHRLRSTGRCPVLR
jgi:hypothetical protein